VESKSCGRQFGVTFCIPSSPKKNPRRAKSARRRSCLPGLCLLVYFTTALKLNKSCKSPIAGLFAGDVRIACFRLRVGQVVPAPSLIVVRFHLYSMNLGIKTCDASARNVL
jgi:hypothetical protein